MTVSIAVLLGLIGAAGVAFATNRVPPDVVALALVVCLVATGLLTPAEAFQGFGSETVVMVLGLLILTSALSRTGVMELLGGRMLRLTGNAPARIRAVVIVTSATLSAFMSNTAATAFLVPVVMGLAGRARLSLRPLLLPLAFASILTSSVTLISTSTNLVVSGLLVNAGQPPLGMFELSPVGLPIAAAGIVYLLVLAQFWLRAPDDQAPSGAAQLRAYLTEVLIPPDSNLVGKSLGELALGETMDIAVLQVLRGTERIVAPRADLVLHAGDVLLVEARTEDLLGIQAAAGLEIKADYKHADPTLPIQALSIVEAILLPRSPLVGNTLKRAGFRQRYGAQVLGISRHGRLTTEKISVLPLQVGDVFLLQGSRADIDALVDAGHVRVLETHEHLAPRRARAGLAVAIFVGALAVGSLGLAPLSVAVLGGAVLAFLTGCITPQRAYREVEWSAILLIGSMLAVGVAMERTGAAAWLASLLVQGLGAFGSTGLMAALFLLTVVLTQVMSNQAAAVVIVPIALQAAAQLDLPGRPFAVVVAVAASCSYLTPLEPACLLVFGPGGYKFSDFPKYGAVMTLIVGALAVWLVPRVWG